MKNTKSSIIFPNLVSEYENYMHSFVENIQILRMHKGWSVRELAEKADMSFDTLQNLLKGKARDCNLTTVVKLARAFGISMDELVGAATIKDEPRKAISMIRTLDPHVQKVLISYAKHQVALHQTKSTNAKQISVVCPSCVGGKLKRISLQDKVISLEKLSKDMQDKIDFGIQIPCEHYEPYFLEGEIVLLAYDREGEHGEMCAISANGNFYICKKHIEKIDGKKEVSYRSITNSQLLFKHNDITDRHGYVVGFLHPNGEWGIR